MQASTLQKIKEYRIKGYTFNEIGRLLNIPWYIARDAWRRKIAPAMEVGTAATYPHVESIEELQQHYAAKFDDTEATWAEDSEAPHLPTVQKIRDRISSLPELEELRRLANKRAVLEEITATIRGSTFGHYTLPPLLEPKQKYDASRTGILLISDVHLGQQTPARLSGGYDYDVDKTRLQFEILYQQVHGAAWANKWDKLIILDLGDTVDGDDMRPSQHRFVGPLVVEQVAMYGRLLAQFVTSLLPFVPQIEIHRVPGNHARTSQRPGLAGLAEIDPADSYDWLAGEFARVILTDSIEGGRVKLVNHDTIYATLDVYNYRVLFEHGSSLRGGGGNIGIPYGAILKSLVGYRELEGPIDLYVLGHFHQPYSLNTFYNTIVCGNGAWPPTSPFVVASKKNATRPSQTLIYLSEDTGVTAIQPLWLDSIKRRRAS